MQFIKPVLANAIWSLKLLPDQLPMDPQYVLDGGALLQRIPWRIGAMHSVHRVSGADPGILKGGGGVRWNFLQKRGGPTTYLGAICIANKQNLLKKGVGGGGGSGPPGHPPWICP